MLAKLIHVVNFLTECWCGS